jgi:hypothetical protein
MAWAGVLGTLVPTRLCASVVTNLADQHATAAAQAANVLQLRFKMGPSVPTVVCKAPDCWQRI